MIEFIQQADFKSIRNLIFVLYWAQHKSKALKNILLSAFSFYSTVTDLARLRG